MLAKSVAILISGKAGVGKSTLASFMYSELTKQRYIAGVFNFAFGVKFTATQMGWDRTKDVKGRKLLQDIGKAGRDYDIDMWARFTFEKIIEADYRYPFDFVLLDDYRFPNEGDFVRKSPLYRVLTLRVEAPNREILKSLPAYNDISETSLPSANEHEEYYDYVIDNTGSIEEYKTIAKKLVENILGKVEYVEKEN